MIHSDNSFATVAYLRIKHAALETKQDLRSSITIPPLLEGEFLEIEQNISQSQTLKTLEGQLGADELQEMVRLRQASKLSGPWITLANISAESSDGFFESEVENCFKILQGNPFDSFIQAFN